MQLQFNPDGWVKLNFEDEGERNSFVHAIKQWEGQGFKPKTPYSLMKMKEGVEWTIQVFAPQKEIQA